MCPSLDKSSKTLHVALDTKNDLKQLKVAMGLRSEADVVDSLIRLYYVTDQFPRAYVEYVDSIRRQKLLSDKK